MQSLFHLAIHVRDLDEARHFYGGTMGCTEGRSTTTWVDFDFFGHQLSLHRGEPFATTRTGHVGDTLVPMPHFGLVLPLPQWQALPSGCRPPAPISSLRPRCASQASPVSSGPCSSATPVATRWKSRASTP